MASSRLLSLLVLFFCIVGPTLTSAECPAECNRNGDCVNDACVCTGNWKGSDCSLYDQYLNSGEVAQMFVGATQWRYFGHVVGSGVGDGGVSLMWWANQSNTEEDCDLYLFKDDYPTLSHYSLRNITTNQNTSILQEGATSGTHYAGVFGYTACSFAISVTEVAGCPGGCGSHGACSAAQCVCDAGYTGEQCQYKYNALTVGETLSGRVTTFEWAYYYTNADRGDHLIFSVDQADNTAADCDLYLAYDRLPTIWDWDFSNVTLDDISVIDIASTQQGRYVLGVYGFAECAFDVTVTAPGSGDGECPSLCSLHGTCTPDRECSCRPGFQGDDCEWKESPLILNGPQTGYVGQNAWNYYNIRVITNNALMISLTQDGESGDCDVYVRGDDKPTHFEFDYIDLGVSSEVHLPIRQPGDATWYIGVFGWEPCRYTLTVTEEVVCDCGFDNPHGECAPNGVDCICEAGWSGADCSSALSVLQSGVVLENQEVLKYQWQYFQFEVTDSSTGVVSLRENGSVGLMWVYVSFTVEPTLTTYDLSDKTSNSAFHEIAIAVPQAQNRTLFIGVYGNPYGLHDDIPLSFDIVAWAAPF